MTKTNRMGIISPWIDFYREIEALFKDDPDIRVQYEEDTYTVKLYVVGEGKANALTQLLPPERTFGNITVHVDVIPANRLHTTRLGLFEEAFRGNPAFAYAKSVPAGLTFGADYVVFKNRVVQYYNDDLSDINGLRSTLYQELAKDIFGEEDGVFFCTDTEEPVG